MRSERLATAVFTFCLASARADDLLYGYEGDVLPFPDAGWTWGVCELPCLESLVDGHLQLAWDTEGHQINYGYRISTPGSPPPPPPPFWVEWRFRSNHPLGPFSWTCDAAFVVRYWEIVDVLWLFGDAAISHSADEAVYPLPLNEFRAYRFETLDGMNFCYWVDGKLFRCDVDVSSTASDALQILAQGGCGPEYHPVINEWDFVRYGTISYGEQIVSSKPPQGFIDARVHAVLDRFTVTFDSANYVFVDEIGVGVSQGASVLPSVVATRRLDNGPPDTVEIVLDRPIPYNATTTFRFDDGALQQSIAFTYVPSDTTGDGLVNLLDFSYFQNCFRRSAINAPCGVFDINDDSMIDVIDYASFPSEMN